MISGSGSELCFQVVAVVPIAWRPSLLPPRSSRQGAAGFLILSQWSVRPDRYGEPSRFDTIPSQPHLQACS
jgi:hypothetical protein